MEISEDKKVVKVGWIFEYKSPPKEKWPDNCEPFVQLHNHTEYSLLDGMSRIERGMLSLDLDTLHESQITLVKQAKLYNQPGVGISDHGTLGGFFRFHTECVSHGINPIIGIEWYLAKDITIKERFYNHVTMFAKNWNGLKNLFLANKIAWTDGFYYRPKVDWKILAKYCRKDTILLSGCDGDSPFLGIFTDQSLTHREKYKKSLDLARKLQDIWQEDFYFEIFCHNYEPAIILNTELINLSSKLGINLVATNDTHYTRKEDAKAHECMLCIQVHDRMTNPEHWSFGNGELYLKSRSEMIQSFKNYHSYIPKEIYLSALDNTMEIQQKVHIDIPSKHKDYVPKPRVRRGNTTQEYFKFLLKKGWEYRNIKNIASVKYAKKYHIKREEAIQLYKNRIKTEMQVITKLGFLNYLLIVHELIEFVNKAGIVMGPGRGSAAASLVCYLLRITNIDPMIYDLMFERFISEYKVSLPDIDLDFDWHRRAEIFDWMVERFGQDNFAHIGTYSILRGKAVIKDVGRVWDVPYEEVNRVTKYIIQRSGGDERKSMTVADSFKVFTTMQEFDAKYPMVKKYAIALESTIRGAGVHACGVVISDDPLTQIVPIETRGTSKNRVIVSAVTGKENEKLGLLKLDILGLKTLSILYKTVAAMPKKIKFDEIDLEDKEVLQEFTNLNYTGIFQFDSVGMRNTVDGYVFREFEDVIVWVALYRPGPARSGISNKFKYLQSNRDKIKKVHPIYDKVTEKTLGCIVYQEQISAIFNEMAGYKLSDADAIRIAISKSYGKDVINKHRENFVEGCKNNVNMGPKEATKLFDSIVNFGSYAFTKAHAAAYGAISYWCMWLKHYYPIQFLAALLSEENDKHRIKLFIKEARRLGIKVETPHINYSKSRYSIGSGKTIVGGLGDIKGIGEKAANAIIDKQPFDDIFDFLKRVERRIVNIRVIKALIIAGAFKTFCSNSKILLENIDKVIVAKGNAKENYWRERFIEWNDLPDWSEEEKIKRMREVLSMPSLEHPITFYDKFMKQIFKKNIQITKIDQLERNTNMIIYLAGQIIDLSFNQIGDFDKTKPTEKELKKRKLRFAPQGARYVNIGIEDDTGYKRINVHPIVYEKHKKIFEKGLDTLIIVKCLYRAEVDWLQAFAFIDLEELKKRKGVIATDSERLILDHPVYSVKKLYKKYKAISLKTVIQENKKRKRFVTAGILSDFRFHETKNGDIMSMGYLDDGEASINVMSWADETQKYGKYFKRSFLHDSILLTMVEKMDKRDGDIRNSYLIKKVLGIKDWKNNGSTI